MKRLILILALLYSASAWAQSCPHGTAYADGCSGAPTGTIQYPHIQDTKAVFALAILGGSGYTNGTYTWTSTGGGCSVAASGTVTVAGGLLGGTGGVNYTVSNEGSSCTSRPTIAVPAGAGAGTGGSITPTVYQTRVPWNAPGVDYYVGVPSGTSLQDPTTASLPSGATFAGHTVTVSGCNVTLTAWDFTLHDTSLSVTASAGCTTTLDKIKGIIGANQNNSHFISWSGAGNLTITNSDLNGAAIPGSGGSGNIADGMMIETSNNTGTLTIEYTYCHDVDAKCYQVNGAPTTGTPRNVIQKYNLFANIDTCNSGCAHGETEYFFGSGFVNVDVEYNTYYDNFWNNGSTATSISAIQADNLTINGSTDSHNIWMSPGPGGTCTTNNQNAYLGAANQFDGSQNDPGTAALNNVTFTYNYLDGAGVFFNWYHATKSGSTNSGLIYANNVDLGAGGLCNQTAPSAPTTPVASPAGGNYSGPQTVSLSNPSSAPVICYSTSPSPVTNGATGCAVGTVYSGPISGVSNETLYWVAGGTGFTDSLQTSATYTTINFTYSVTMAGNHAGDTVTSSPAGINCPTTCSVSFASGTSVTLTENPSGQYFAYGFSSPCPVVTNFGAPCTLVISSATSVTANFNHVTLPQLWTNNMEYLFATSNVVNFPTFWLCNGGTRYPASGNYANTAAGLTQVGNDAEQCRHDTNTGTTIIVPAGQPYSSANGLQITQLAGDNSTQFIVFTSSNPAPLGVTLCSHGIQDNIPSATKPGLWNPGCTGLNMYYQLGTTINTIPVGAFTLANNTATNTSQYNDIAHLFTLEATGANQNAFSTCVTFAGGNCTADWDTNNVGVHHIAILNAELRPVAGQASAGAPYKVGLATETLVSQIPNHIHLAYSYIHGDWQEAPMSGCPSVCVATGIPAGTNSLPYAIFIAGCLFCSEMYNYVDGNLRPGAEGHGLGLLLAQENKRAHNWIAGGSIGSICGGWGASMPISNFITCLNDEDRANRYTYPYSWMLAFNGGFNPSGGSFVRKNAHEYKFARFALFDGSICENVDNSGAQNGTACSFKTAQNSGGGAGSNYWTELTHVTASNIIGRTACNGPSFGDRSAAVGNGGGVSMPSQMFNFSNWLFYNLSINLAGCFVSGFSSAPQYSIRNGQSVPSATWSATATRDALGQTTTFTLTAGSGNGVTDFSLGDPLTSTACSDATFNVGNTVMGPPVLSGSTLGTTAPPLTLIVNNPGTANATATGCTVSNAQGYPNYIFLNHATIIADAGHNGPYDSALSGTNIHALARNISYQNSIFVNGGLSSSSGEGTAASTRDYDPTTFTFNNSFIGGRTAANYTEYPSLASPPTTLYLTPTNNCTGNDPTTGTCLGILAAMSTSTFPLVPGAVGSYIAGDYHAFRLCQATDVACNSKQSLYGAGNTNQATDGSDLGVNFATLDAAQNSTLYVCATPCGLGPSIDTIAIVPAPYTPGFLGYNKPIDIFKGATK